MATKHFLCRWVPKMEHHKCRFKRTSRENYSSNFDAVYYFFCYPFIHRYSTMEVNYRLKFDQHSTIPYIVTNPRRIILVKNWPPSSGDGTGEPTETMTARSRSTLIWGLPSLCLDRIVPIEPLLVTFCKSVPPSGLIYTLFILAACIS